MWAKSLSLCLLALGSDVSAGIVSQRSSDSFSLYAYGENIGGLPLYYADGKQARRLISDSSSKQPILMIFSTGNAVIANHTPDNATDVGQVACE